MAETTKPRAADTNENKKVPFLSHLAALAQKMFKISDEDRLILENIIDEKGQLKLYHPVTQAALLALVREKAVEELKRLEEEEKARKEAEEAKKR